MTSVDRMPPAAYGTSWADALHMLAGRSPEVANRLLDELSGHENPVGCLGEVSPEAEQLDSYGFVVRPSWVDLRDGARPPVPVSQEPGEWQPGWQHHASSAYVYHFRETVVLAQSSCVHTEDLVAERCSTVLPPNWSSSCNLDFFAHCHWRDCVSRRTPQKLDASAARGSTELDATGQLVHDPVE